jgi:hypothetical protein
LQRWVLTPHLNPLPFARGEAKYAT